MSKFSSVRSTAGVLDKRKATGAHFTPPDLASFIAHRLLHELAPSAASKRMIRVLDPSCGDGELLVAFGRELPDTSRKKFILLGVESDEESLQKAQSRLGQEQECPWKVTRGDFLELARSRASQPLLWNEGSSPPSLSEAADVVVANPPYVRTQILGSRRAQSLASAFGLTGRVDLYHAFFVAMTDFLSPGGYLGVVTSNRYLTTKGGASLRDFLGQQFEVIEIIDLGDTKLFQAAVLPALFFGRKRPAGPGRIKSGNRPPRFVQIYENPRREIVARVEHKASSIVEILSRPRTGEYDVSGQRYTVKTGTWLIPHKASDPWTMTTSSERKWLELVNSGCAFRLSEVANIRVGVKTTADEVFIRSDWENLPTEIRPEEVLLRPLLSHSDAQRWRHDEDKPRKRILYTHEARGGHRAAIDFKDFPRAWAYLNAHRKRLERRHYVRDAGRQWYEIWVPQDPSAWRHPKVVLPDISPVPKFFLDWDGCLVDGDCYWISLLSGQKEELLFLIMAVANSRLMMRYHDLVFPNRLYSGRRRYLTQYVELYPMPDPSLGASRQLIVLGRELSTSSVSDPRRVQIETDVESLVEAAFGFHGVGAAR
ncbi:MAG: Eco57I restriction-modification methylase domain-containing protein [Candidatus Methylomirabilales bacterium]